jgi:zinc protease
MPGKARSPAHYAYLLTIVPFVLGLTTSAARAIEVQRVVGATGVRSWLVESQKLPLVVLQFAFRGAGSVADPPGREGLASFGAEMLLEGAKDLDSTAFQERLSEIGVVLAFSADRDALVGHLQVPRERWEDAVDLLRSALTQPRFDADAVERVRRSLTTRLARLAADPGHVALQAWWNGSFPNHPYARDPDGSPAGVAAISATDLRTGFMPRLARPRLLVGAAGAINARELADALDRLFGDLPTAEPGGNIPEAKFAPKPLEVSHLPFPQSACVFGHPGVAPRSPDYLPATVLNHVIGGGTLTSRLFVEMREKRGLVYSVRTMLDALPGAEVLTGRFSTENRKVRAAIGVVKDEWRRAAKGDVSDEEVREAKDYLRGALPVSMDGTAAIAAKLLSVQRLGLDVDYITQWDTKISAVDLAAVRATAQRILHPEILNFAVAGNPEGL